MYKTYTGEEKKRGKKEAMCKTCTLEKKEKGKKEAMCKTCTLEKKEKGKKEAMCKTCIPVHAHLLSNWISVYKICDSSSVCLCVSPPPPPPPPLTSYNYYKSTAVDSLWKLASFILSSVSFPWSSPFILTGCKKKKKKKKTKQKNVSQLLPPFMFRCCQSKFLHIYIIMIKRKTNIWQTSGF